MTNVKSEMTAIRELIDTQQEKNKAYESKLEVI